MNFKKILTKKDLYNVFEDDDNNILIMGKTQLGNDYIIDNAHLIINDIIKCDENIQDQLIWLHGYGPSPHFIFYKNKNISIDKLQLEMFIKSNCSKKSELQKPLSCCMLRNVKKTSTLGLVHIKHEKLSDLLEN